MFYGARSEHMSRTSRTLGFAAVGGFLGAIVMSVILVGSKVMMGLPATADFMVMGSFAGGQGEGAVTVGLAAHFLTGIIVGLIFGAITAYVSNLTVTGIGRGLLFGVIYGFGVYIILFLPLLMMGFAPIMMAMMGPTAAAMAPTVMAIGLVEHLIYGGILGTTVAYSARSTVAQ